MLNVRTPQGLRTFAAIIQQQDREPPKPPEPRQFMTQDGYRFVTADLKAFKVRR